MNSFKSAILLAGATMLVLVICSEARYNGRPSHQAYSDSGCHGHNCHRQSYAAPAVYGGRGLYNYHGYTRHQPAPPLTNHAHYRGVRSYSSGGRHHYQAQQHHQQSYQSNYGMRPVHAVVLAPANNYGSNRHHYGQTKANYRHLAAPSYGYKKVASYHHNNGNNQYRPAHGVNHHRTAQSHNYRRPSHGSY